MDPELLTWLQFVKVQVEEGRGKQSGYLTALSCRMLQVELERHGFKIVRGEAAPLRRHERT
jgi:hypothetical protein